MSALSAIEGALLQALKVASELEESFGAPVRIVEGEDARAAFPFLRLSRHQASPDEPADDGPVDHRLTLELFSRAGGRKEAARLVGLVESAIRSTQLTPEGHRLILFYPVYSDVFLRRDGVTFRGIVRLRALSEPQPK